MNKAKKIISNENFIAKSSIPIISENTNHYTVSSVIVLQSEPASEQDAILSFDFSILPGKVSKQTGNTSNQNVRYVQQFSRGKIFHYMI